MDERTREKLVECLHGFVCDLIKIADEENYDRDNFIQAIAQMFSVMAEIGTFQNYQ